MVAANLNLSHRARDRFLLGLNDLPLAVRRLLHGSSQTDREDSFYDAFTFGGWPLQLARGSRPGNSVDSQTREYEPEFELADPSYSWKSVRQ